MNDVNELIGKTIEAYQIERLLGQSQLGVAYLARHVSEGHKAMVTIFRLPSDIRSQEYGQRSERFARDGEALVQLAHPHILPVYAYGIRQEYAYLITAFAKEASLAQFLKRNVRLTPQQALPILKQLAEGLDYVHSRGIVHGMLSLSNIIVSNELDVRIAGFGLMAILDTQGNSQHVPLVTQITQERNTPLLNNAEYIAPERLMGQSIDGRADIYALGVVLFVLLSGEQPFKGKEPLDIAIQRLHQPVPSLHAICPDVSEALDLVIGRALQRDPAKRLQSAGEMATLFKRVLKSEDPAWLTGKMPASQSVLDSQITLPPTINWFDDQAVADSQGQVAPLAGNEISPTRVSDAEDAPASVNSNASASANADSLSGTDPFDWWATTSATRSVTQSTAAGTFPWSTPIRHANGTRPTRRRVVQGRRRFISLLVAGTAAAGVTVASAGFARFVLGAHQAASQIANGNTATPTVSGSTPAAGTGQGTVKATKGTTPTKSSTPQPTATKASAQATPTAQPTATQSAAAQPTATPRPTATQSPPTPTPSPGHSGTVIGSTNMATNSSKTFTNPADGSGSLLIHLSNGNFVACERACTHEGVAVNYDPGSQTLVCPAHGAVFNPTNGFSHVSGPGNGPLPTVNIRVNADGTITTG